MGKGIANTWDVLSEFDQGIFKDKLVAALESAGKSAVAFGRPSKVTVELTFTPVSDSRQCHVAHKLVQVIPHDTGKNTDEDTKKTIVHVHGGGQISIYSEDQLGFEFGSKQEVKS